MSVTVEGAPGASLGGMAVSDAISSYGIPPGAGSRRPGRRWGLLELLQCGVGTDRCSTSVLPYTLVWTPLPSAATRLFAGHHVRGTRSSAGTPSSLVPATTEAFPRPPVLTRMSTPREVGQGSGGLYSSMTGATVLATLARAVIPSGLPIVDEHARLPVSRLDRIMGGLAPENHPATLGEYLS